MTFSFDDWAVTTWGRFGGRWLRFRGHPIGPQRWRVAHDDGRVAHFFAPRNADILVLIRRGRRAMKRRVPEWRVRKAIR